MRVSMPRGVCGLLLALILDPGSTIQEAKSLPPDEGLDHSMVLLSRKALLWTVGTSFLGSEAQDRK